MSGNFGHLTHVRELSGNFVVTFFLDCQYFHHIGMDLPGLCLCKCLHSCFMQMLLNGGLFGYVVGCP